MKGLQRASKFGCGGILVCSWWCYGGRRRDNRNYEGCENLQYELCVWGYEDRDV